MPSAKNPAFRGKGLTIDVASPNLGNVLGNPVYGFQRILTGQVPQRMDNIHIRLAQTLTETAHKNLDDRRERPWEVGSRPGPRLRLTGTLFGGSGHKAAVRGEAINKGKGTGKSGSKVGRGVGWPVLIDLERRARHWRSIEFGAPYVTMPKGLFVMKGTNQAQPTGQRTEGHIFMTVGEFYKKRGLRGGLKPRRLASRRARRKAAFQGTRVGKERGGPIEAKFFLTDAWNSVVGPRGEHLSREYQSMMNDAFKDFKKAR